MEIVDIRGRDGSEQNRREKTNILMMSIEVVYKD